MILVLGCICPMYQLMLNRKSVDGASSIDIVNCLTSWFFSFCCEFLNRRALAAKYNLKYDLVMNVLLSIFCGPCIVWQGLIIFYL